MKFVYCIIITIAMIAITTRSSINVKKWYRTFIFRLESCIVSGCCLF